MSVSIPFRADTVFELVFVDVEFIDWTEVSIPFRADTVFELAGVHPIKTAFFVSIPFRADTVFEHKHISRLGDVGILFQSLSGLTLCLNSLPYRVNGGQRESVSIPFRADTGFELSFCLNFLLQIFCFNPFQG